ncbi:MAG: M3 family metallopeptidase [Myxococcales bacterium]
MSAPPAPAPPSVPPPETAQLLVRGPEAFTAACEEDVKVAKASVARLKTLDPAKDGQGVLTVYDAATGALSAAASRASLARETHPEAAVRDAARACEQQIEQVNLEITQDRAVFDALSAVELAGADAATKYWMARTLLEFRRAGVDRDEATRGRVKALNEELVKLGQAWGRNIAEDVRQVELDPAELAGLPADYVKAHSPNGKGKVVVTSNYPDYFPFMTYATNGKAREKVWRMYRQRAHPQNVEVLKQLIARRHELATLLGYDSWAAYATETRMTGSAQKAGEFIQRIGQVSLERAKKEHAELLARKQKDDKRAKTLEPWDQDFYEDRLKAERFGFDSQAIRPWFEYGRVKQGLLDVTSRIFGIRYRKVEGAPVWHSEVEGYDVLEGEQVLGRIYLDMHPRADKYKHAAQFDLASGQKDVRLPEGVLVCNFPRPGELMTFDEVKTLFHEFGHLLHHIFSGRQQWLGITGIRTEWDFVETPSMLLEEWVLDPAVLALFAKHHETGEALPAEMVQKLKASREFGKGLWTRRQAFLASVSLEYYSRAPGFDPEKVLVEQQQKLSPFRHEWRDGTHFQLAFGHLDGYSAIYYTYLWSLVIAKDLHTAFEEKGHLDVETTMKYRRTILEPGGSQPAAELVKAFLGREYGFDSFQRYLERN